jgi:hypothetical protein
VVVLEEGGGHREPAVPEEEEEPVVVVYHQPMTSIQSPPASVSEDEIDPPDATKQAAAPEIAQDAQQDGLPHHTNMISTKSLPIALIHPPPQQSRHMSSQVDGENWNRGSSQPTYLRS